MTDAGDDKKEHMPRRQKWQQPRTDARFSRNGNVESRILSLHDVAAEYQFARTARNRLG